MQSFVHTLSAVWRRPSLTALEVAWRWVFGVPALCLIAWKGYSILGRATGGSFTASSLGLDRALVSDPLGALTADPMGAAGKIAGAIHTLMPGIERAEFRVGIPLLIVWVIVSTVGRALVMRRLDGILTIRIGTLLALQAIRIAALEIICYVWAFGVAWSANLTVISPIHAGAEPSLVLFCAMLIVGSLAFYTAWTFVSWLFWLAPLLAVTSRLGVGASLRAALGAGAVRGKLIEVNLVLSIVRIALLVLAMVFSATPLPFEAVTTPQFLAWWWAAVALVWMLGSDFFHVARTVGYLELWRAYERNPQG